MPLHKNEKSAITLFRRMLTEQLGDTVREILLFGSKARGDDRPDSDIDLLVICNTEDWHIADVIYEVAVDVLLRTDVSLSPKVLLEQEYRRMQDNSVPFVANVLREGVAV